MATKRMKGIGDGKKSHTWIRKKYFHAIGEIIGSSQARCLDEMEYFIPSDSSR